MSVVENRRLRMGKMAQRRVLDLGEINDSQQAAWRKTLEVFVESERRRTELSLFPEDREIPRDAVNSIQIKLDQVELRRPRAWGKDRPGPMASGVLARSSGTGLLKSPWRPAAICHRIARALRPSRRSLPILRDSSSSESAPHRESCRREV